MTEEQTRDLVVRQDNRLIESYFSLTVAEMRFIFHLAARVRPEDTDFTTYSFSAAEIGRMIGDEMLTYAEAEALTLRLYKREVHVASGDGTTRHALRWITEATRNDNTGMIEVALSARLQPYLLRLAEWTKIRLELLTTLRSAYAIRLFLMACKVRNQRCPNFTLPVTELRARLEISSAQYPRFVDFNRRVLKEPIEEINAQGEVHIKYEVERKGCTPNAVRFIIDISPSKSCGGEGAKVAARINERRKKAKRKKPVQDAVAVDEGSETLTDEERAANAKFMADFRKKQTASIDSITTRATQEKRQFVEATLEERAVHERRMTFAHAQLNLITANGSGS